MRRIKFVVTIAPSFIIFIIGPKYFGYNKMSINKESVVFEGSL